ncbi:unnamed protein product [Meloidogyne enterolobii]|uniref:Uncharacterized protein n=1 Tax=Meloidogyne enterolobii TaxID=390850 RepID=A0ACB0XRQ8_MELEN
MKTFLHCFLIAFLITASIVAIIYMIFPTSPIQVLLPQTVRTETMKENESKNNLKNGDLEKINEKIWNSIKNEIGHNKVDYK